MEPTTREQYEKYVAQTLYRDITEKVSFLQKISPTCDEYNLPSLPNNDNEEAIVRLVQQGMTDRDKELVAVEHFLEETIVGQVIDWIVDAVGTVAIAAADLIGVLDVVIKYFVDVILTPILMTVSKQFITPIVQNIDSLNSVLRTVWEKVGVAVKDMVKAIANNIVSLAKAIVDNMSDIIKTTFSAIYNFIATDIMELIKKIAPFVKDVIEFYKKLLNAEPKLLSGFIAMHTMNFVIITTLVLLWILFTDNFIITTIKRFPGTGILHGRENRTKLQYNIGMIGAMLYRNDNGHEL